jgi:hypothetical protein
MLHAAVKFGVIMDVEASANPRREKTFRLESASNLVMLAMDNSSK